MTIQYVTARQAAVQPKPYPTHKVCPRCGVNKSVPLGFYLRRGLQASSYCRRCTAAITAARKAAVHLRQ